MSAYDDAVAYLDAEVHPRCDYEIYSDMRDIVDEMEVENAKLRELCADLYAEMIEYSDAPHYNASVWTQKLRDLGIDVAE